MGPEIVRGNNRNMYVISGSLLPDRLDNHFASECQNWELIAQRRKHEFGPGFDSIGLLSA